MLQIMASYLFNADKFKSFIKKNKIKDENGLMIIVNNIGEKGEFLHNAVLRITIPRVEIQ